MGLEKASTRSSVLLACGCEEGRVGARDHDQSGFAKEMYGMTSVPRRKEEVPPQPNYTAMMTFIAGMQNSIATITAGFQYCGGYDGHVYETKCRCELLKKLNFSSTTTIWVRDPASSFPSEGEPCRTRGILEPPPSYVFLHLEP